MTNLLNPRVKGLYVRGPFRGCIKRPSKSAGHLRRLLAFLSHPYEPTFFVAARRSDGNS
jgi:hypothetical protein